MYAPFTSPVILEDNVRYMFCVEMFSELFRIGYNSTLNYDRNQATYDQPITQVFDGTTWFVGGFVGGGSATTGVLMVDANTIGIDENGVGADGLPYPNPATEQLRVPLKGFTGMASLNVSDANGKLVAATHRVNASTGTAVVSTSGFAQGLYTFHMVPDNGAARTFKVMLGR